MPHIKKETIVIIVIIFTIIGCSKEKKETSLIRVITKIGSVSINIPGKELNVNDIVKTDDIIITGKNSLIELLMHKGSAIKIYENAEFIIEKNETDKNEIIIDSQFGINRGKLLLIINKLSKNSALIVKTPTAVASLRGTSFVIKVNKKEGKEKSGSTELNVINGKVYIETKYKPDENRLLGKGEMVIVSIDKVIEDKKAIPKTNLKQLENEEKNLKNKIIVKAERVKINPEQKLNSIAKKAPTLKTEAEIKNYYNKLEEINLDDGTTLIGAVIFQNKIIVKIHTANGIIQVPTRSVKNIRMK